VQSGKIVNMQNANVKSAMAGRLRPLRPQRPLLASRRVAVPVVSAAGSVRDKRRGLTEAGQTVWRWRGASLESDATSPLDKGLLNQSFQLSSASIALHASIPLYKAQAPVCCDDI